MFSYQTLRSVTFLPDPTKIMVGEANERYLVRVSASILFAKVEIILTIRSSWLNSVHKVSRRRQT